LPYTTSQAISDIDITLPGSYVDTDNVSMNQSFTGRGTVQNVIILVPGVGTTAPATDLNLTVTGLMDSGTFAVYDAPTTGVGPNAISPAYSPAGYTFPTDA